MHKEVLIAVVFGILLGLGIAFGIWNANKVLQKKLPLEVQEEATQKNNNRKEEIIDLTIVKPTNKSALSESPAKVSGITKPNILVAISGEKGDSIIKSDTKGEFSETIDLVGGINQILVFAFDKSGNSKNEKVMVVHSTSIDQNEEEKNEFSNLSSYLGTITDITESSFQIRTSEGEIKQISVNEDKTTYVSNVKETKNIEFSDLAIGDFIVAVGEQPSSENAVFSAKRIIVTLPVKEPNRKIIFGKVKEISDKSVTLLEATQESNISLLKKPSVYAFKEDKIIKSKIGSIEKDNTLIIIALVDEKSTEARTIQIL